MDEHPVDTSCKCVCYAASVVNKVEGCAGEVGVIEGRVSGSGELSWTLVEYGEGTEDSHCVSSLSVETAELDCLIFTVF